MAAPVKHTCPDIDRAEKHLKDVLSTIKYLDIDKREKNNLEWDLDAAMGYFEQLRKANHELREWGEDLETELVDAKDEVYDLEQKIEEFKSLALPAEK